MRVSRLLTAGAVGAVGTVAAALVAAGWAAARPRPAPAQDACPDPPKLPPGRVVAVPGCGELFVREHGRGPGILLLHGWMVPADPTWFRCYEPLGALGRVLALDLRGHGRGSRTPRPFRLTEAADETAALLQHLEAGPVVAVGYSMGGPIAQLLWRRHPELVRGLVFAGTAASFYASVPQRWMWRTIGLLQLGLRLLPRAALEELLRAQVRGTLPVRVSRVLGPHTPEEVVALMPWAVGELLRGSPEDLAEAARELARYDARGWAETIDVPSAVLINGRDRVVPPWLQRDLADRLPDTRSAVLPVDHDGLVAAAELYVPTLCELVADVLARSTPTVTTPVAGAP